MSQLITLTFNSWLSIYLFPKNLPLKPHNKKQYYQSYYMKLLTTTACLLIITLATMPNQGPIIGIFTQTDLSDEPTLAGQPTSNHSYIAASYVKYVQMSGAQVVPIFAYSQQAYFDQLLPKLSGVLFPGGDADIDIRNKWTKNADYILKYSMEQHKKGNTFPVWGTCLGMQLLAYLTCGYDAAAIAPVRGQVKVRNTLDIQADATLFKDLTPELRYNVQNGEGILYFNHHYAVTGKYYQNSPKLKSFWNVQAYTTTSFNEQFLSVFKARDYPIYGVQFHPEKNLFEWKVPAIRSTAGAEIVQYLSRQFVELARQSQNKFDSYEDFRRLAIYNYKTQFTTQSFIQIYLFNEVSAPAPDSQKSLTIQTQ